jgi:hypothetical protein
MKNAGYSYKSANRNVNGGSTMGGKGSPKSTSSGSDTGMHATNVIKKCGVHTKPYSPNANSVSKNR